MIATAHGGCSTALRRWPEPGPKKYETYKRRTLKLKTASEPQSSQAGAAGPLGPWRPGLPGHLKLERRAKASVHVSFGH